MERRLAITSLVAYLTAAVPHLVFHAGRLEPLSAGSGAGLMALPGAGVVVPAALLCLAANASAFAAPEPLSYRTESTDHPTNYRPGGANNSS